MLGFAPLASTPLASTFEENIARVSGVQASALLNSVTVIGTALVQPSGLSATGGVGTVSIIGTANITKVCSEFNIKLIGSKNVF